MKFLSKAALARYFIIFLPVLLGVLALVFIASGNYGKFVARAGAQRLITENWQKSYSTLMDERPEPKQQVAYYMIKEGQKIGDLAEQFGVPTAKIIELNPGILVPGVTVKIPPVEKPLEPKLKSNGLLDTVKVIDDGVFIRVRGDFEDEQVVTTMPELANFLSSYGAIEQTKPKVWRIKKPLSIEDNIRIDFTPETVKEIQLRSDPDDITCLCFEDAASYMRGIAITTYQTKDGKPDTNYADERSYVRARKSTRMDAIDVHFSFLGNSLIESNKSMQNGGGVYGVSWRIPDDRLHIDIVTGWVEGSTFYKNHFGAYTFGASGMRWADNHFLENDVYGLDPHDDSNNALITGNVFEKNGKHGFIVSKRCNNNIIRNNRSSDNGLHGFMLHQDSTNNLIELNEAYGNTDNYVVYDSKFNVIKDNIGRDARSANVRINNFASDIYVLDNDFKDGQMGAYVYRGAQRVIIDSNTFANHTTTMKTAASNDIYFANNSIQELDFDFDRNDTVVFGPNLVESAIIKK